jgi:hypothetical protein
MPANWDANRLSAVLRISTQIVSSEPLTISIGSLRFSKAAGYLPASLVDTSLRSTTIYNFMSGGGGNCTRVLIDATNDGANSHEMRSEGWPEHGREDEALSELVASWHCLTPSVRDAIMDLIR